MHQAFISSTTLSVILETVSLLTEAPYTSGVVGRNLSGRQIPRGGRQHDLVDPGQPPLPLLHDLRLEARVGVARHVDLDWADLGQHRLRPHSVAGVAGVSAHWVVLVIAQMLRHLLLERGLEHLFRQPGQQPVRTDQVDALGAGLLHQLLSHALLIQYRLHRLLLLCCHVVNRVSHDLSPLGSQTSHFHRFPVSPATVREGEGEREGIHQEHRAAPAGRWRPDNGALARSTLS